VYLLRHAALRALPQSRIRVNLRDLKKVNNRSKTALKRMKLRVMLVKRIFSGYFALKGLNVAAQGETLGNGNKKNMNPEGV